ncbi:hypothetical protein TRFO_25443 [Tritrichomonas foetus]|uniref:Uncharacterized protein n=1 Tax=Tritrichomonas foetus TaxID=1144522 RepID=A0A1J4KAL7_9EUKA|nr:hypothetical protein TRFO_25443 [Tritrichomonas foetus]|eukprot:OHT06493.1 hypothetical protein TRFO_25443 [Tritrichomonas foetus]
MTELANLRNQTKRLQHEKELAQSRIASLESDIANLMKKKRFSSDEISDYFSNQRHITELQEKLQRAEAESMELRSTLASQSNMLLSTIGTENPSYQSIIEANNKYAIEMTQKAAKKQKLLSDTMFENASLKKSISITEAENAKLTAELQDVKWKLENSLSSSYSNKSQSDKNVQELQKIIHAKDKQLKEAQTTITELQNSIRNTQNSQRSSILNISNLGHSNDFTEFSREIEKHKEELRRAQMEIQRLTEKNKESDAKILAYEKTMKERELEHRKLLEESARHSLINQNNCLPENLNRFSRSTISESTEKSFTYSNVDLNISEEQMRDDLRNTKAICVSLRDENKTLRLEIDHLRMMASEYKEAFEKEKEKNMRPNALRDEVFKLRDELKTLKNSKFSSPYKFFKNYNNSSINEINNDINNGNQFGRTPNRNRQFKSFDGNSNKFIKNMILRYASDMQLKFDFFQTKIQTELDKLELKFERFETCWNQFDSRQKRHNKRYFLLQKNTAEEFVKILKREARIIKDISIAYAEAHNIPKSQIPHPAEIMGDSTVLQNFVLNTPSPSSHRKRSHQHR